MDLSEIDLNRTTLQGVTLSFDAFGLPLPTTQSRGQAGLLGSLNYAALGVQSKGMQASYRDCLLMGLCHSRHYYSTLAYDNINLFI